jgi:NADPH:quinone reductase-like Zn-dependent oxidoreductase
VKFAIIGEIREQIGAHHMKQIIYEKYGSPAVLQLKEVEKPTPKENEVLVKIHAASVNALDWHLLTADIFLVRFMGGGVLKPKNNRLGADMAGIVEAVGAAVSEFKPGDAVFGDIAPWGYGGFGEYVAVPEKALAPKPANLSFEQAAAVPVAGFTALQGLRDVGQIQAGQRVLIQGAAGGVGTFAVQIAKYYAAEVTAVTSARNLEQARSLGADHLIDYAKEDFTQSGQQYDLILGVNGYHPLSAYKRAMAPQGIYVMAGGQPRQIFQAMLQGKRLTKTGGQRFTNVSAKTKKEDLLFLKELLETGKIVPLIDRTYPLSETAEALRYLGTGHARAKVIVKL